MRLALFVTLLSLAAAAGPLTAQGRSPTQDLLVRARSAYNDLRFDEADSMSRAILEMPLIRRADRIQALQLSAAARFPEMANAQHPDSARATLAELIRIAPGAQLSRELAWPGLDALLDSVRATTFGAAATFRSVNVLIGPNDRASLDVVASQPASFILSMAPRTGGGEIVLDSAGPSTTASLHLSVLDGPTLRLRPGAYEMRITAVREGRDTTVLRYGATVEAPDLALSPLPAPPAPSDFRRERSRPDRMMAIFVGALLGGSTIAAANVMRDPVMKASQPHDSRSGSLAVGLGLGALAGGLLLDHGHRVQSNVEYNEQLRAASAIRLQEALAARDRALAVYRTVITIDPEPR